MKVNTPRFVSTLEATREMSRSAHRWRDRAAAYYDDERHKMARRAKLKKEECYQLKERGIIAMHRAGDLRYIGASPQGMAVYAYGDHNLACLHSCLHPAGVERVPVPNHPEVLLVPGKKQRIRICDAAATLNCLDSPVFSAKHGNSFAGVGAEPQNFVAKRPSCEGALLRTFRDDRQVRPGWCSSAISGRFATMSAGTRTRSWRQSESGGIIPIPLIPELMTIEERNAFEELPEQITIYRGCGPRNKSGMSWSLSRDIAVRFPFSMRYGTDQPMLLTATIRKNRAAALKLERNEQEIIVVDLPESCWTEESITEPPPPMRFATCVADLL